MLVLAPISCQESSANLEIQRDEDLSKLKIYWSPFMFVNFGEFVRF